MALSKGRSPLGLKAYEDDVQGNGHRPLSPTQRHRYEHQRLLTFANWPDWAPASAPRLAKHGFFYTGRDDEVECFSCHRKVRGWKLGDNPENKHRQVSPNCHYINGVNKENIPIYVDVSSPEENAGLQRTIYAPLGLRSPGTRVPQGPQHAEGSLRVPNGNSMTGEVTHGTDSDIRNSADERTESRNEATRNPRSAVNPNAQVGVDTTDNLAVRRSPPTETRQNNPHYSYTTSPTLTNVHESEDFMLIMRENELTRMQTYANFPDSCPVRPSELAKAGFFYLGTSDIVKCAYCGGMIRSWDRGDDAFGEHVKHFPLCSFVQQRQNREQSSSQQNNLLFDDNPIVTERPKHPQYAIEQNRILTFENWPISKRQTPRELSIAGFYYAGFGDNVKCFFCGGGLRNWEPQDDIWTEHARWFPNCGYVKQCKGVSFIREILQRNSANGQFSGQAGRAPHTHQIEAREIKARLDAPSAQKVIAMGYSRDLVRKAIENRLTTVGDDFPNLQSLIEALLRIEEEQEQGDSNGNTNLTNDPQNVGRDQSDQSPPNDTAPSANTNNPPEPIDPAILSDKLRQENELLKEQRICKICKVRDAEVVFLPCAHLVSCNPCSPSLRKCPVCGSKIRDTVKTYLC
ncbi:baculoviral IAP repeat-containing protein 7-A-like [Lingula anatina]|uniref:Baculoviral IAP repeat-containing protein 7-A-like n=1 Tax=Lingula anatina TaxID=7574 RepID=A0A1S3I9U5_LINAN|nr:baculoviral IAP repeat-containing protein 7-A-like [Lingula anatina]|eukprot:XP_013394174.1 baculoviral IAP repeat-containing protein 7-A-like [Lingula anatina]